MYIFKERSWKPQFQLSQWQLLPSRTIGSHLSNAGVPFTNQPYYSHEFRYKHETRSWSIRAICTPNLTRDTRVCCWAAARTSCAKAKCEHMRACVHSRTILCIIAKYLAMRALTRKCVIRQSTQSGTVQNFVV